MNARTMNVKKNISAAPRSRIKNSSATQTTQKIIYFVSERVVCNLSRVAAPTKTNATLTNSDGWMDIPPILSQLNAPFMLRARIRVRTSRPIAATAMGVLITMARSTFEISQSRATKQNMPSISATNCVLTKSLFAPATVTSPMPVRKNAIISSAGSARFLAIDIAMK